MNLNDPVEREKHAELLRRLFDEFSPPKPPEQIERTLRIIWGEVAPVTYADLPTYADMPSYGDMARAFGDDPANWPKRNTETLLKSPERLEALRSAPRQTSEEIWARLAAKPEPRDERAREGVWSRIQDRTDANAGDRQPLPDFGKGKSHDWTP
jgi:hypothetical protein